MTASMYVLSLLLLLLPTAMQAAAAVDNDSAAAFNLTPDGVKLTDPQVYFDACRKNMGSNICNSYSCYTRHHDLDLRQLDSLSCGSDDDCLINETGMKCFPSYGGRGYCSCERHSAYNASSCACQKAELCSHKVTDNETKHRGEMTEVGNCFNGMVCIDPSCSCRDLSSVLYEPSTRFCVAPRSGDYEDDMFRQKDNRLVIVGVIIAAFLMLAVAAIVIYVVTERCSKQNSNSSNSSTVSSRSPPVVACCSFADCFDRGEYECDDDRNTRDNTDENGEHVAAWELPSLDYLSEEQTMKYLRTHHHRNTQIRDTDTDGGCSTEDAIEVIGTAPVAPGETTSSSSSSSSSTGGTSSLPESDRQEHVNRAYVHDEGGGAVRGVRGKIV